MAQDIPQGEAPYQVKITARVYEYAKEKDPAVDPPDRVIESDPEYRDPEDIFPRRNDHGNDQ